MASAVEIINKALSYIGDTSFIEDYSDPQNERERLAALHYDSTRDQVLQDFPWSFAKTFVQLALLETETPGWGYTYRYPSDCLTARMVTDEGGYRLPSQFWFDHYLWHHTIFPIPKFSFEIQADKESPPAKVILCDVEDAYLWYIRRVTDENQMSTLFREGLAWRLAMKFAIGLKADMQYLQNATQMYAWTVSQAQAHALNEANPDPQPESPAIQARL